MKTEILLPQPLISVILPVYNGAAYLALTIQSILEQTYHNFELLIVNNGSTDDTEKIARTFQYQDSRVHYFKLEQPGLIAALNYGIHKASGELIARTDYDDISLPMRFQKQVDFLQAHPNIALLGTWAEIIDEQGKTKNRFHRHPNDNPTLQFMLLFDNFFVHSTLIMRKEALITLKGYSEDPTRNRVEDYELITRFAQKYEIANFPEVLVQYREVTTGRSRTNIEEIERQVKRISLAQMAFICDRFQLVKDAEADEALLEFIHHVRYADRAMYQKARLRYQVILKKMSEHYGVLPAVLHKNTRARWLCVCVLKSQCLIFWRTRLLVHKARQFFGV